MGSSVFEWKPTANQIEIIVSIMLEIQDLPWICHDRILADREEDVRTCFGENPKEPPKSFAIGIDG